VHSNYFHPINVISTFKLILSFDKILLTLKGLIQQACCRKQEDCFPFHWFPRRWGGVPWVDQQHADLGDGPCFVRWWWERGDHRADEGWGWQDGVRKYRMLALPLQVSCFFRNYPFWTFFIFFAPSTKTPMHLLSFSSKLDLHQVRSSKGSNLAILRRKMPRQPPHCPCHVSCWGRSKNKVKFLL